MIDYIVVRCRDRCDVKTVICIRVGEYWTDHSILRAKVSLAIKKKMRKFGPKFPKRIDVFQMACVEKLKLFQFAVQAIDPRCCIYNYYGSV